MASLEPPDGFNLPAHIVEAERVIMGLTDRAALTDEEMARWESYLSSSPYDRRVLRLISALRAERAGVAGIEDAARTVIAALEAEVEELRDQLAAAADALSAREG